MRQAVEALKKGNVDAYFEAIGNALGEEESDMQRVKSSLRQRRILRTPDGKPLDPDQIEALRERIGSDAVDRLQYFDLMLDAAAGGQIMEPYEE